MGPLVAYYCTLAAFFAASFFPELRLWGLSWWGYFPLGAKIAVFTIAALAPFGLVSALSQREEKPADLRRGRWFRAAVGAVVIFLIAFIVFRTRMHFLGDGYQLLSRLASGGVPIRPWNPGVYWLQDAVYRLFTPGGEAGALLAFRLISWVAGLIFLVAVALTATRLIHRTADRIFFTLGIATGGYALLFFGYVENYAFFVTWVACFCLAGLLVAEAKLPCWTILIPLLLAGLFHPFAVALLPATAFLFLHDTSVWRRRAGLSVGLRAVLVGLLVLIGAFLFWYAYTLSFFLRFALVPLVENQFTLEGYTLLSAKHLADLGNLLILLVPGLLIWIVSLRREATGEPGGSHSTQFLLWLTVPSLLIVVLFDPKLSMVRDWDIFAFAGIPLCLLCYCPLTARSETDPRQRLASGLAIAVSILLLIPRVGTQMDRERAMAVFDHAAERDLLKNRSGRFVIMTYLARNGFRDEAERRRLEDLRIFPQETMAVQGQAFFNQGRLDSAVARFKLALAGDPTYAMVWDNLGVAMLAAGQVDSALAYLKIADGLNPYNPDTYNNLGGAYHARGDSLRAEDLWKKSLQLKPAHNAAADYLRRYYAQQQRRADFERLVTEMAARPDASVAFVRDYADLLVVRGDFAEAANQYRRALQMGLDSAYVREMEMRNPQLRVIR